MARTTRKTSARKPAAKRKAVRTTKAKRTASAKKAARTRAANKRKRSASAKKAAATRKRNSRRKPTTAKRTASKRKPRTSKAKRSAAAKKGWASRRSSKRSTTSKRRVSKRKPATRRASKRTTTKRTTSKAKRSRAAKKGWATRKRNSGRRGARKSSKRTSKRRTSRRRSSRSMKMPSMKGLKGGLRTLVMGATAIGLVGLLVYTPLNLVAAQTQQITTAANGVLNSAGLQNYASDLLNIGAGVATLAVGGMIFQAAKKRKMFTAKTQTMLMPFLIAGVSLNTVSKLQTMNIGSAFGQLATGKPAAALNNFSNGRFSIRRANNNLLQNPLNQSANPVVQSQGQNGARLGMANMGSIYGTHTGGSNALYQNNSANSGRIFGSRLGSAKRKVNLF